MSALEVSTGAEDVPDWIADVLNTYGELFGLRPRSRGEYGRAEIDDLLELLADWVALDEAQTLVALTRLHVDDRHGTIVVVGSPAELARLAPTVADCAVRWMRDHRLRKMYWESPVLTPLQRLAPFEPELTLPRRRYFRGVYLDVAFHCLRAQPCAGA